MKESPELQETASEAIADLNHGIKFTSLHHIDHDNNKVVSVNIDSQSPDLIEYIQKLLEDIQKKDTKRAFLYESETAEVRIAINLMLDEEYDKAAEINANRLLKIEKETQATMEHLDVNIQKGSLFQTVISFTDHKMIIIGKADHNEFLDASDFSLHKGLPWKKKIFKSFLAIIDNKKNINKILVADTTNNLTKYWWSDFFELKEARTDQFNTKTFLDVLDKKVFNPIKHKHQADHTTLRNSVIGYFRANDEFNLDDLCNNIFEKYVPDDAELDINDIKKKIKGIPKKYGVDSWFKIDKKAIKKREVHKILLNEGMELVLKGGPDLNNITPYSDREGKKYIMIQTEEGYNRFKK